MTTDQEEQAEKLRVTLQDADLRRQQGTTFKAFADADTHIPGRFESIAAAHVVGSTQTPKYPAASTPFQRDPVGIEPNWLRPKCTRILDGDSVVFLRRGN
jgi:hypothetical protein